MDKQLTRNQIITGTAVFAGMVEGPVWVMPVVQPTSPDCPMSDNRSADLEMNRYDLASERVETNMIALAHTKESRIVETGSDMMRMHRLILTDPGINKRIRQCIANGSTAYDAIKHTYGEQIKRFEDLDDPRLQARALDLYDICSQLLHKLGDPENERFYQLQHPVIVAARDITPSQLIALPEGIVLGIVCEQGNNLSHTAILAAARSIPTVFHCTGLLAALHGGPPVNGLLDGEAGTICLNPDRTILTNWNRRNQERALQRQSLSNWSVKQAVTADGIPVHLLANIMHEDELQRLHGTWFDGFGLIRTEGLFRHNHPTPDEEIQAIRYQDMVRQADGRPMTFRTFDLENNKETVPTDLPRGSTPAAINRGLARSLQSPDEFLGQLRAIVRASAFGTVAVLFPLVQSPAQFQNALELLETAKAQLKKSNQPFDPQIRIGAMIETPQAVDACFEIMQLADFVSIGSNDLARFSALERGIPLHAVSGFDPVILRLIARIAQTGATFEPPADLILCGEMAASPQAIGLWLSMGIRGFSVAPHKIQTFKQALYRYRFSDLPGLTNELLALSDSDQVLTCLNTRFSQLNASDPQPDHTSMC